MGQYKQSHLQYVQWLRNKEKELQLIEQIIQHVENPKLVELKPLEEKLGVPAETLQKLIEKIYGPKTQIKQKLYHWWQEPDGAIRKIDSRYLHKRIKNAMKKLGAENPYQLAKKLNVPEGKVNIIRDWMRQSPIVSAKTRVLKRIFNLLGRLPPIIATLRGNSLKQIQSHLFMHYHPQPKTKTKDQKSSSLETRFGRPLLIKSYKRVLSTLPPFLC